MGRFDKFSTQASRWYLPFIRSFAKLKNFYIYWQKQQFIGLGIFYLVGCQALPEKFIAKQKQEIVSSEIVLSKLLARKNYLTDFKSFAKTTILRNRSTQTLKQIFLIKNCHFIRIDTLSIFGYPIGIFIHNHQKTMIYDPREKKIYRGRDVWKSIEQIIGTTLDISETISLLSGNIPKLETLKLKSTTIDEKNKYYELQMQKPFSSTMFQVKVDTNFFVPTQLEKRLGRNLIYTTNWKDYKPIGNHHFAHHVAISRLGNKETLTVKYRKPNLNSGIQESAFTLFENKTN